jgi:hypothetical protein
VHNIYGRHPFLPSVSLLSACYTLSKASFLLPWNGSRGINQQGRESLCTLHGRFVMHVSIIHIRYVPLQKGSKQDKHIVKQAGKKSGRLLLTNAVTH